MKPNKSELLLSNSDFDRLNALIEMVQNDLSILLEEELARAIVVPDEHLPAGVVTMYSLVKFRDLDTGQCTEVQLVYPQEADASKGRISVLAPIGAALIGLSVGQSIQWPVPGGRKRTVEVVSVVTKGQEQAS